jgi:hypothetical protein
MHVEDKTKAFRQVVRKDQLDRLQEVRKAPEQWTTQNYNGRRRMPSMRRNLELKSKENRDNAQLFCYLYLNEKIIPRFPRRMTQSFIIIVQSVTITIKKNLFLFSKTLQMAEK